MLGLPHGAPRVDSGANQRITTDSSDSTSFRNGTEAENRVARQFG
jgi:hypothetical protein